MRLGYQVLRLELKQARRIGERRVQHAACGGMHTLLLPLGARRALVGCTPPRGIMYVTSRIPFESVEVDCYASVGQLTTAHRSTFTNRFCKLRV